MPNLRIRATLAAAALLAAAIALSPAPAGASESSKGLTVQTNLRTCSGYVALSSYPRPLWQDGRMNCGAYQFTPPPEVEISGRSIMYPLGNGTLAREVASAWCWDDGDGTTTSGCDVPRKSVGPLLPQSRYEGRFTVLITLDEASFDSYGERWGALPPECALAHPTAWRVIRCQLTVNYFTPDIGE